MRDVHVDLLAPACMRRCSTYILHDSLVTSTSTSIDVSVEPTNNSHALRPYRLQQYLPDTRPPFHLIAALFFGDLRAMPCQCYKLSETDRVCVC